MVLSDVFVNIKFIYLYINIHIFILTCDALDFGLIKANIPVNLSYGPQMWVYHKVIVHISTSIFPIDSDTVWFEYFWNNLFLSINGIRMLFINKAWI